MGNPLQVSKFLSWVSSLLSGTFSLWTQVFSFPQCLPLNSGSFQAFPKFTLPSLLPEVSLKIASRMHCRAWLICFLPFKDQCVLLLDVLCLGNNFSSILSGFFPIVSGGRVNQVRITHFFLRFSPCRSPVLNPLSFTSQGPYYSFLTGRWYQSFFSHFKTKSFYLNTYPTNLWS